MIENNNKKRIELIIMIALSTFMIVNYAYFLENIIIYLRVIVMGVFLVGAIMYIISYCKNNYKLRKRVVYCIIALFILNFVILAVYYLTQILGISDYYGIQEFLASHEKEAKYIYFLICLLQPIILSVPEAVTIMAGSSVFGPFEGAVIGFTGTILGIIIMFFISRFASKNILNKIIDSNKLEKFNRYIEKNESIVIAALFIFPILPDEIICVGSGLTKVSTSKFITMAIITKLITSFSLSYSLQVIKIDFTSIAILVAMIMCIIGIKLIKSRKIVLSKNEK